MESSAGFAGGGGRRRSSAASCGEQFRHRRLLQLVRPSSGVSTSSLLSVSYFSSASATATNSFPVRRDQAGAVLVGRRPRSVRISSSITLAGVVRVVLLGEDHLSLIAPGVVDEADAIAHAPLEDHRAGRTASPSGCPC